MISSYFLGMVYFPLFKLRGLALSLIGFEHDGAYIFFCYLAIFRSARLYFLVAKFNSSGDRNLYGTGFCLFIVLKEVRLLKQVCRNRLVMAINLQIRIEKDEAFLS